MARPKKPSPAPVQMFTWGYDGWGNHTDRLVEMVDAVEKARGFEPPLFVDVRIRRAARAVGFRSSAFEELLGSRRYRWIRGLGNRQLLDGTEGEPIIHDPAAAKDLLDLALASATRNRRVLFFCSCAPPTPSKPKRCHRFDVAELLLERARKLGVALIIQEWPGGEPRLLDIPSDRRLRNELDRGLVNLSLPEPVDLGLLGGLPLGSVLRIGRAADAPAVAIHRLAYRENGWYIKSLGTDLRSNGAAERLLAKTTKLFHRLGHGAVSTT